MKYFVNIVLYNVLLLLLYLIIIHILNADCSLLIKMYNIYNYINHKLLKYKT